MHHVSLMPQRISHRRFHRTVLSLSIAIGFLFIGNTALQGQCCQYQYSYQYPSTVYYAPTQVQYHQQAPVVYQPSARTMNPGPQAMGSNDCYSNCLSCNPNMQEYCAKCCAYGTCAVYNSVRCTASTNTSRLTDPTPVESSPSESAVANDCYSNCLSCNPNMQQYCAECCAYGTCRVFNTLGCNGNGQGGNVRLRQMNSPIQIHSSPIHYPTQPMHYYNARPSYSVPIRGCGCGY